jgi:hypothetical protein
LFPRLTPGATFFGALRALDSPKCSFALRALDSPKCSFALRALIRRVTVLRYAR